MIYASSAPRRALGIDEIVRLVLQHLRADSKLSKLRAMSGDLPLSFPDLFAAATVSQALSACALDLLWQRSTPWRLAWLIVLANPWRLRNSEKMFIQGAVLNTQAMHALLSCSPDLRTQNALMNGRFCRYSTRVRRLCWAFMGSELETVARFDEKVMSVWYTARSELLPQLTELWLGSPNMSVVQCALRFMHHGSQIVQDRWQLPVIPHRLQYLQHLELDAGSLSRSFMEQVICAASCLKTLRVNGDISWVAFEHTSRAPELRELRVNGVKLDDQDVPRMVLPSSTIFPHLEILKFDDYSENKVVLRAFTSSAGTSRLRKVVCKTNRVSWLACVDIVAGIARFCTLVALDLRFFVSDVPENEPFKQRAARTASILGPLRSLAALEQLRLAAGDFFTFEQAELLRTLASWPHLRSLETGTHQRGVTDVRPALTLSSFGQVLALCPKLTTFYASIDCTAMPTQEEIDEVARLRHPYTRPLVAYGVQDLTRWREVWREALPHIAHIVDDKYEEDLLWTANASMEDSDFY